jgi:hypothetical protein
VARLRPPGLRWRGWMSRAKRMIDPALAVRRITWGRVGSGCSLVSAPENAAVAARSAGEGMMGQLVWRARSVVRR